MTDLVPEHMNQCFRPPAHGHSTIRWSLSPAILWGGTAQQTPFVRIPGGGATCLQSNEMGVNPAQAVHALGKLVHSTRTARDSANFALQCRRRGVSGKHLAFAGGLLPPSLLGFHHLLLLFIVGLIQFPEMELWLLRIGLGVPPAAATPAAAAAAAASASWNRFRDTHAHQWAVL